MHYCEDKNANKNTTKLQRKIIEIEKPNFVIYTGDMISGEAYNQWIDWLLRPGWYRKRWEEYTKPVLDNKIPYCIVMGNHDLNGNINGEMIVDMDRNNPYSLTKHSPRKVKGETNYVIPVYDYEGKKIVLYLWIFDSQVHSCKKNNKCGSVDSSAIKWYISENNKNFKKNGRNVPGLVFFHIPTPEYAEQLKSSRVKGEQRESISCPLENNGLISALLEKYLLFIIVVKY